MDKGHLVEFHMQRQGGRCAICGEDITQMDRWALRVDRILRGEDGGTYVPENTQLICLDCDWSKEGNAPASPRPKLRAAYDRYRLYLHLYGDFVRRQKAISGQAKNTSRSPYFDPAELLEPIELFGSSVASAEKELKRVVREQPEWTGFMKGSPGLGEPTAGFLLSHIDIRKADTVSKVWRYLGLDPTEPYNPGKGKMRAPLYAALSISLIRKDSLYRQDYDGYRSRDVTKKDGTIAKMSHGGAIRRLIKLWLSHLWETWRRYEGLPVRDPYIVAENPVHQFIPAKDRGWPEAIAPK